MCPVCLPRLNPGAFLHAYIAFLHPASGLAVALLSAAPDAFLPLSRGRALLEADLNQQGVTAVRLCPSWRHSGSHLVVRLQTAAALALLTMLSALSTMLSGCRGSQALGDARQVANVLSYP